VRVTVEMNVEGKGEEKNEEKMHRHNRE